ncbi:MAG: hypothetical protein QY322_00570 [bacterium]|nr:MAG: hypothetical protein QY322_00570 [bacterium]
MKVKFLLLVSFLFLVLATPVLVSAQGEKSRPTPGVVINAKVRTELKNSGEENRIKLSLVRKERIMSYSNKLTVRLDAMVERLKLLITRIENRIKIIEEENDNVILVDTRTLLSEAKQLLLSVEADLRLLKEKLNSIPEAQDPKVVFEEVRTSLMAIKDDLKEVHRLLIEVISDIKGLRVGDQ